MKRRSWVIVVVLLVAGVLAYMLLGRDGDGGDGSGGEENDGRGALAGGRAAVGASADDDSETVTSRFPWKNGRASIAGTVTVRGGGPLAGAQVCAWLRDDDTPSAMRREPKCTTSGADGRYRIEELPAASHGVDASAPQHVPDSWRDADDSLRIELAPGQERGGIDIALEPGGVEIHGLVKDVAGGVIEGALVSAQGEWIFGGRTGGAVGRTNEGGEFSLWVKPGTASVTATAEGYADGFRSGAAPGFTFEVVLTPESVLVGRVVHAGTETPVADVRVSVGGGWDSTSGTAFTDAEGRYRIDRLKPGRYQPAAHSAEGYGRADRNHLLGLGETSEEIVIPLHAAVAVRGRIAIGSVDGESCMNGWVSLTDKTAKDFRRRASARDGGRIEVIGLLPGTYEVAVGCKDRVASERYDDIVVADAAIDDVVWLVHEGAVIRGRVVDDSGRPIASADVSASPKQLAARAQVAAAWGERSDQEGRFELRGLLAGKYAVEVDKDGLVNPGPQDVDIADGATPEIEIVMRRGGRVVGHVRDEHGKPVEGATVTVTGLRWRGQPNAMTRDDGGFELDGIEPGEARVYASIGWTEMRGAGKTDDDVQGERVVVEAGADVEVNLVVRDRSGRIAGRVVDADGGPVHDAFVHATRETESATAGAGTNRSSARWGSWARTPVLTDADGGFELDELEPGLHTVFATRKGGGEGFLEHASLGDKALVVRIGETGSISGTVKLAGGGFPERFVVSASDRKAGGSESENLFRTDGRFTIEGLPPGTYEVAVTSSSGDQKTEVTLAEGEARTGVELVLTPRTTVRGRIVDADDGSPVANLNVSVQPASGRGFSFGPPGGDKQNITDADGRFTVTNAPTGKVRIAALPMVWGEGEYNFVFSKSNIPSDVAEFELPDIRIAKRRLGRDERAGDLGFELKNADAGTDWDDRPLTVAVVRPGGPAEAAGLKVGATITSIDGHDVTGTQQHLAFTLMEVPPGKRVEIGLQDGKSVAIVAGKPK